MKKSAPFKWKFAPLCSSKEEEEIIFLMGFHVPARQKKEEIKYFITLGGGAQVKNGKKKKSEATDWNSQTKKKNKGIILNYF